jgi:putative exosortase-associated protein (TIGR04073 family)
MIGPATAIKRAGRVSLRAGNTEFMFLGTSKEKEPHMKKSMLVLGIAAFILMNLITVAVAAEDNAFTKFGRGMANVVISPAELYAQPVLLSKDHEIPIAFFGGLFKGISMFLVREVVGVYEMVTFPIPLPKGYRPLFEPATTFTDWSTRYPQQQN